MDGETAALAVAAEMSIDPAKPMTPEQHAEFTPKFEAARRLPEPAGWAVYSSFGTFLGYVPRRRWWHRLPGIRRESASTPGEAAGVAAQRP